MDKQQIPSFERILANMTMLPKWFDENNIIGVYWTLETELIFYGLCWLLFTGRLHTNPLALSVIITGLVSLTYFLFLHRELAPDYHYWLAMPYHLSLMFWAALYRLYENRKTDAQPMGLVKVLLYSQTLVIALPVLFAFVLYLVNKDPQALRNATSYFLGIGLFLVLGHWLPLRSRWLASLGKYTFSIYLFHLPVILILAHVVGHHFPALAGVSFIVYLLIVTAITLAISWLCYHCIEYPCMQFAQKTFPGKKPIQPVPQSGTADRKPLSF